MSNPTNPASYPMEFAEITDIADAIQAPWRIELESEKEAKRFQFRWYGYLRALERNLRKKQYAEGFNTKRAEEIRIRKARSLSVSTEGSVLIFTPRHLTRESQVFAAALAKLKDDPRSYNPYNSLSGAMERMGEYPEDINPYPLHDIPPD